jgi:hypothetical protein
MAARHPLYVAMNDPQWLGHGAMLTGTVFLLLSRRPGALLYAAVFAMVLGGFIKHNLIPLPIAATLWIFVYRRGMFIHWLAASLLFVGGGITLFTTLYGENFVRQIFFDARIYSLGLMATGINKWFTPMLPLALLGILAIPVLQRLEEGALILLYGLISVPWAVFILGGAGVDQNAVFDVAIALTMAVGILIGKMQIAWTPPGSTQLKLSGAFVLCLTLTISPVVPTRLFELRETLKTQHISEAIGKEDVSYLLSRQGPAMCENLALCYWAGKTFEVDYFLTGQKVHTGVIDERGLTKLMEARHFAIVQFDNPNGTNSRLPDSVIASVHENYALDRTSEIAGSFFVPRTVIGE